MAQEWDMWANYRARQAEQTRLDQALDIDQIVAYKLNHKQIVAAYQLAYGNKTKGAICKELQIGTDTLRTWEQNRYFIMFYIHIRQTLIWSCREEFTELHKAVIKANSEILRVALSDGQNYPRLAQLLKGILNSLNFVKDTYKDLT